MSESSSGRTGYSSRFDDYEDHRSPSGQGGCACCEERGFLVDSRRGSCNTKCSDRYLSSPYLINYVDFMLIFMFFILGSFLVNGISALVLFDLGATRSFVSLTLSKRFAMI